MILLKFNREDNLSQEKPKKLNKKPQGFDFDGSFEELIRGIQEFENSTPAHQIFSTGSLFLDSYFNPLDPGIPAGQFIMLYGEGSTGKTSFCLNMIRQHTIVEGGITLFIDAEGGLMPTLTKLYGICKYTTPNFLYSSTTWLDDALDKAVQAMTYWMNKDPNRKVLIVIDGIGTAPPKPQTKEATEKGGSQYGTVGDDGRVGTVARILTNFAKYHAVCQKTNCLVVMNNQPTTQIMGPQSGQPYFGGGNKIKVVCDMILHMTSNFVCLDNDDKNAHKREYKDDNGTIWKTPKTLRIIKNKNSSPKPDVDYSLIMLPKYGYCGFDDREMCAQYLFSRGKIRSGAWYHVAGSKWQGYQNFYEALQTNPDVWYEVQVMTINELRAHYTQALSEMENNKESKDE